MEILLEYIKKILALFEQILAALGIEVDWSALWGDVGL